MPSEPAVLANVRNAARDMARDLVRFERDFARFQRCAREAREHGATDAELTHAVNEAAAGHPDLRQALATLSERLAAERAVSDA